MYPTLKQTTQWFREFLKDLPGAEDDEPSANEYQDANHEQVLFCFVLFLFVILLTSLNFPDDANDKRLSFEFEQGCEESIF